MKLERIDLHLVRLPLARPFRTSSSVKTFLDHILVRVEADGISGWGECASPSEPYYCAETVETCWHLLKDILGPLVLGKDWETIDDFVALYSLVKGNRFARSGLEIACWDLIGRQKGQSIARLLGGSRSEILSGVSLGIEDDIAILFDQIARYVEEGYRRFKLKIAPGRDVEIVRQIRDRYPDLPLQVDANSAYTLDDLDTLRQLDAFQLLMIEQPLAHDDIIDHARLQSALATPVCLDESIHSADDARKAIDLNACRVINIKVSRLGGPREAKRVHDTCFTRGVPVWCGGMHEFGIGRAANLAVASLAGFTIPGDVSGSDRSYPDDLVDPPILARRGVLKVPEGPGLGVAPRLDRIAKQTLRTFSLTSVR